MADNIVNSERGEEEKETFDTQKKSRAKVGLYAHPHLRSKVWVVANLTQGRKPTIS